MDMTTSMNMATSMTSTSAMATSTSMDMSSSSDSGTSMTSADMAMVFFQSVTTPLFSASWTPSGASAYTGTCIFLVALAVVHRALLALRHVLFESSTRPFGHEKLVSGEDYDQELIARRAKAAWNSHPFRVMTEAGRALFEVLTGAFGYLLMLAVMTMNVGYFLSILGGIFLGSFLVGRFGSVANHH